MPGATLVRTGACVMFAITSMSLGCKAPSESASGPGMPPVWLKPPGWENVELMPDGRIVLSDGRVVRVAGVTLWNGGMDSLNVRGFLKAATRQGVHIERLVGPGSEARMACAPYFVGHEGGGRPWSEARAIVLDLGELLVFSGYATLGDTSRLTPHEAERLACAQGEAQFFRLGAWSKERRAELSGLDGGTLTGQSALYRYDSERGLEGGGENLARSACDPGPEATADMNRVATFARERAKEALGRE